MRNLTIDEMEIIVALEMDCVKESKDLNEQELVEFEEIIRADIQRWTLEEYYNYLCYFYKKESKKKVPPPLTN